ncbi:MAG: winged helix-turn-helix domain-containing protein [Armatimonadota bacterium]|nr:winged helix-turn-helix domain-containing protein [Armatimonadota bacterium]MDR7448704.1 winged helix-turn-helix domain-containing protein [Armatimonadota bacterium]MDR7460276.1 winged helix-turn-helix domain-containing protein [Armatimonadota bacterium]MDR7479042.1 winged helix-turn-helix domain-containing protein [Armatimonadota bacterium]MDR7502673.1 winged helix-turn-helix domain-containing protein [Armatimonadota bacterium]
MTQVSQTRAAQAMVGREAELRRLAQLLGKDARGYIVHLHGIAGVGKSALLVAFAARARRAGAAVVALDCRVIEPTERGFLQEVGRALGGRTRTVAQAAARLGRLAPVVIVTLDNYEVFRLMDTWLRQVFVVSLPTNVRLILSGRQPPVAAWLASSELEGLVDVLPVGPLPQGAALELLIRSGVSPTMGRRLLPLVRGHPLAIKLAARAVAERPDLGTEDLAAHRVVEELTRVYLADVSDAVTRQALAASSVVRRTTLTLLRALLPDVDPHSALERLQALPFVEMRHDGLVVHETVQEAISSLLRSTDPERHRQYRKAAWRQLRQEASGAAAADLWRYTADMLYLVENPLVREAFFPTEAQPLAVEPARQEDASAIRQIFQRHEPPEAAALLEAWWRRLPSAFSVIRDRDGTIIAFYCLLDVNAIAPPLLRDDPVVQKWWRHLQDHPIPRGQTVIGLRQFLDLEHGSGPSVSRSACWLDVKRTYMALRPHLRRVYAAGPVLPSLGPVLETLGFRALPVPGAGPAFAVAPQLDPSNLVLDFGPGSVDSWLAGLVAAETGIDRGPALDERARELTLDGRQIRLTQLEFGVLKALLDAEGRTVSRAELLEEVWGYKFSRGSNVVDAVVCALRRKLGTRGEVIEAVRGVGYRLRRDWRHLLA